MLNIGDNAPHFSGIALPSGKPWSLSDHKGKVVLVSCDGLMWCSPCVMQVPILQELLEELQGHGCTDFEFVIVNSGVYSAATYNALKEFLKINNITITLIEDPDTISLYEVGQVPTMFYLNNEHKICAIDTGFQQKWKIRNTLAECGLKCLLIPPQYGYYLDIVRILFGVTDDSPGIVIPPGGKPIPIGPWNPVGPYRWLNSDKRDVLTALAINQLADQLTDIGTQRDLQVRTMRAAETAVKSLLRKARQKPRSLEKDWMELRKIDGTFMKKKMF